MKPKSIGKLAVRKRTLVDQVYDYIRERILDFSLKPGEKIDVKGLAQKFSLSQTPIREALHKLVEQGLVILEPYVGYFVVQLTPTDIEELFDLRQALELLALRSILIHNNINEALLDNLRERVSKLAQQNGRFNDMLHETRTIDDDLHLELIIKGTNNKWLTKIANGVIDLIKLTTRLSLNPKAACEEHQKILDAIAERDLEGAASALELHLERAKRDSIKALLEQQEQENSSKERGVR